MKYENENYVIDYLNDFFEVKKDKFWFKSYDSERDGKKLIKEITNMFKVNKDMVELMLRGWAFENGMTQKGWDFTVNGILWMDTSLIMGTPIRFLLDIDDTQWAHRAIINNMGIPASRLNGIGEFNPRPNITQRYARQVRDMSKYYNDIHIIHAPSGIGKTMFMHNPFGETIKPKFRLKYNKNDELNNIRWEDYLRPEGQDQKAQIASFLEENGFDIDRWGRFGILRLVRKETILHSSESPVTWGPYKFHKRFAEGHDIWEWDRKGETNRLGKSKEKVPWTKDIDNIIHGRENRWSTLVVDNPRRGPKDSPRYTSRDWVVKTALGSTYESWVCEREKFTPQQLYSQINTEKFV